MRAWNARAGGYCISHARARGGGFTLGARGKQLRRPWRARRHPPIVLVFLFFFCVFCDRCAPSWVSVVPWVRDNRHPVRPQLAQRDSLSRAPPLPGRKAPQRQFCIAINASEMRVVLMGLGSAAGGGCSWGAQEGSGERQKRHPAWAALSRAGLSTWQGLAPLCLPASLSRAASQGASEKKEAGVGVGKKRRPAAPPPKDAPARAPGARGASSLAARIRWVERDAYLCA